MDFLLKKRQFSSFQIIIAGFSSVILAGSLLLMLPFSTRGPGGAPFLDALFTSTSAVCVTGLVVHDTATYWSEFGQFIILLMIQTGGMGVVTVAVAIAMISGKKISLMQRSTMQEALAAPKVGGIVRLTRFILRASILIELLGVAVMAPVFCRDFGLGRGLWYAVFHSVSAFCNAGFDLMGIRAPYSSLTSYAGHPVINLAVMTLIIVGGIGFLTWDDVWTKRHHFRKYRLQSKVILVTTIILILLPTLFFYFHEFASPAWQMLKGPERLFVSLFQAVTPRTAGFNTVDLTVMSEAGQMIVILLMLIGGSPGSTAGGMKTTTAAVLLFSAMAVFRRREDAQCFGRRLQENAVKNAAAILLLYLVAFLSGGLVISCMEGLPVLTCMFETASAIGTVGLSLGITGQLCASSRLILVVLMFMGRVGGLTLVFAATSAAHHRVVKLPQEKIIVG